MTPVRLLVATGNPGKVREYERLLAGLPVAVETLASLPGYVPPEETGETFAANAVLKASAASRAAGIPALADDSGLCVEALGGAPGVHSARFAGEGASDADRRRALLRALAGVQDRAAAFECVIALASPDGPVQTLVGRCDGAILEAERGDGGFGYDPLFVPSEEALSFAEMTPADKDRISHRGRAAAGLPDLVARVLGVAEEGRIG